MAWRTANVTLSGNTQVTATRIPVRQVIIHNPTGNATISVGDSTLTATVYAFQVAAGASGPSIGPFSGDAPLNLNEIYIRGTDAEIVRVGYVTH